MRRLAWWVTAAAVVLLPLIYGLNRLSKNEELMLFGEAMTRVETDQPIVALTLDDGPSRAETENVLAMLAEADARATFFLVGKDMADYPEGVSAILAGGHEIGNHSYRHRRMVFMTPGAVRQELADTDALILAAGQEGQPLFRPPYGHKLVSLPWVLQQQGRAAIMWSVEGDFVDPGETPEAMAARIVDAAQPGDIIILHVMWRGNATSRAALPMVLEGLREKGLRTATMSELLAAGAPE